MQSDPRAGVLIAAKELAGLVQDDSDLVILAVRNPLPGSGARFDRDARIPGAIDIDLPSELAGPQSGHSGARPLPAIADLQRHARRWGIRQSSPVVVYDHDRCLQAGRAWWVLRWAGIADVRMLDGGFAMWQAAGLPVSHEPGRREAGGREAGGREAGRREPGDVTLSAGHLAVLDADQAARLARESVLLDSRIRANYIGGQVAPGHPARGHIPGAISAPAADNLTDYGTFADAPTLRALYGALGADGTRELGVYCGVGISATHDIAALATIGITAALFVGSWSAWSSDPARPVVIGAKPE